MKSFCNKIIRRISKKLLVYSQSLDRLQHSESYPEKLLSLAKLTEAGVLVAVIKPATIEEVKPLRVYGLINDASLQLNCDEQSLRLYHDATVYPHSDLIICQNKAIWNKYYQVVFTKNKYQDRDVVGIVSGDEGQVLLRIKNDQRIVRKFERVYSLCGVHAHVWSHFMIQYLPKLYYMNRVGELMDRPVTLLLQEQQDTHLVEAIDQFVAPFGHITVEILNDDEIAVCKELYYMDSATQMIDHENYVSYVDMIIPSQVAGVLKTNFVEVFQKKYLKSSEITDIKLYIRRKNAGYRNMIGVEEVEHFFQEQGFLIVEPHLLSFEEKVNLFYRASFVAGPNSAGFSNLIFSRKRTKVLMFSNLQRCFEPYLSFFYQYFELDFWAVSGKDLNDSDSHSDFEVALDKIKKVYGEMLS